MQGQSFPPGTSHFHQRFGRLQRFATALGAAVALLSLFVGSGRAQSARQPAAANASCKNPSLPIEQRVDCVVSHMTLQEKVSQMQNHSAAIPRLGIAEYDWWSEALHGVARSGYATVFPQAIGMAATWDAPLIRKEGHVIGIEGRGRYNSAVRQGNHSIFFGMDFWAPNVNIFRDPRWGRGQETHGEDPFLTGQMAIQFVEGLQGDDPRHFLAIATPKHFDVHSGPEPLRHKFNVDVSPHDLYDTYLPAFRAAIVQAHADSIMCAYNAVDGVPACANRMLLQRILRGDWEFHGYVVSDCGAIGDIANGHKYAPSVEQASVDAVRAGVDLSCGNEFGTLVKAVHDGVIQESEIDTAVKRLMTARIRLGILAPPDKQSYSSLRSSVVFSPEHERLNLRASEEAMVLLKNDGTLPLQPNVKTIAVIGPNAASLDALEGNYNGTPIDPVTPLAAFYHWASQKHLHILDAQGSPYVEQLPLAVPPSAFRQATGSTQEGLKVTYFSNTKFSGQGVEAASRNIDADWDAASPRPKSIPAKSFSARWTGIFTAPAPGDYQFQVVFPGCYPCGDAETYAVWFNGKQVAQGAAHDHNGRHSPFFTVHFADTKPHAFRMDYSHRSPLFGAGVSLQWKPSPEILREQAVELAKRADVVVAVVGLSPRLEGEEMPLDIPGFDHGDRTSIDLPKVQTQMLEAIAKTGKPLVVVLMNGSALAVNWAQKHANAILEAWYPGARGGEAVVNTLFGKNNPAGRLPVTFYTSTNELPPFTDYSMANRTYRYFRGPVLYGFGYGLSYSNFTFSHLNLSKSHIAAGDSLIVSADVSNVSNIAGDEVAELYIEYPRMDGAPLRALAGFTRIHLAPGETQHVSFPVDARRLSYVQRDGKRVVSAGEYTVYVGGSQPSNVAGGVSAVLTVTGEKTIPR